MGREDVSADEARRQALEIHDNVVQGLASAKLALELGHHEEALDILDHTLAVSRRLVTDLISDEGFRPSDLKRAKPGGVR